MQRKTIPYFTLMATVFVMMSLIVLRAPLVFFDSIALEFPSMLGSIFLRHEFSLEFLNSLQNAIPIFSRRCPILFPKNPKILSHKRCLYDTSKHTRWLTQILQTQTQYEKVTMNLYKET